MVFRGQHLLCFQLLQSSTPSASLYSYMVPSSRLSSAMLSLLFIAAATASSCALEDANAPFTSTSAAQAILPRVCAPNSSAIHSAWCDTTKTYVFRRPLSTRRAC